MIVKTTKHFEFYLKKAPRRIQTKVVVFYDMLRVSKDLEGFEIERVERRNNYYRLRIDDWLLGFYYDKHGGVTLLAIANKDLVLKFILEDDPKEVR